MRTNEDNDAGQVASRGAPAAFVAVDWGTSSFRGWLMSAGGDVLAESRGSEGMLHCSGTGFAPVLRDHLARLGAPEEIPVLICGMACARQGWVEAPYLKTPTRLDALHEGAVRIDAATDIRILPGVAQARADRPDVMLGEETQLLGVTEPGFTGLVCIPGTHSKWIRIEAGRIVEFSTYMTGELYAVMAQHSILAHALELAHEGVIQVRKARAGFMHELHDPRQLVELDLGDVVGVGVIVRMQSRREEDDGNVLRRVTVMIASSVQRLAVARVVEFVVEGQRLWQCVVRRARHVQRIGVARPRASVGRGGRSQAIGCRLDPRGSPTRARLRWACTRSDRPRSPQAAGLETWPGSSGGRAQP